jgi:hypothetical protein
MAPAEFDNIKLIARSKYDVMAAWDNRSSLQHVAIYLGHWNDGFVAKEENESSN